METVKRAESGTRTYKLTDKGLTIPQETLKAIGVEEDIELLIKKHFLIIRPKSVTKKVRGIIRDTPLTGKGLDEFYLDYKSG